MSKPSSPVPVSACPGPPREPEVVVDDALETHDEIRIALHRMVLLARRVMHGDRAVALALATAMGRVARAVRCHISREQTEIFPLLERLDAWGATKRAELSQAHDAEIDALFNADYYGSHLAMAEEATSVARALYAALRLEEEEVLTEELVSRAALFGAGPHSAK